MTTLHFVLARLRAVFPQRFLQNLGFTLPSMLGRCVFCMRSAFLSAVVVWLGAAAAAFLAENMAAIIIALPAAALSMLWFAHLTAYAIQVTRHARADAEELPDPARRAFFPAFAKTFALAALATSLPGAALAMSQCQRNCYDSSSSCINDCQKCCSGSVESAMSCSQGCTSQLHTCLSSCS